MIRIKQKGNYHKLTGWLGKLQDRKYFKSLGKCADKGVEALKAATPVDSGKTADSWGYIEYSNEDGGYTIYFANSNKNQGRSVALLIDRGHGKKNGGYVPGLHFIKPTIEPYLKEMTEIVWKEVTSK